MKKKLTNKIYHEIIATMPEAWHSNTLELFQNQFEDYFKDYDITVTYSGMGMHLTHFIISNNQGLCWQYPIVLYKPAELKPLSLWQRIKNLL